MECGQVIVQSLSGIFAGISLVSGLLGARFWYLSAKNRHTVDELTGFLADASGHKRVAEWLAQGANFNKWAAIWTAVSVAAGALCVALDHFT